MINELLSKEFSLDVRLVELLINRGIDSSEKMNDFLYPSIKSLTDINNYPGAIKAAERINKAISGNERVLIYGDYDCDGICSVSMLYMFLNERKATVYYYIPSRHNDGYGLNLEAIIKLKEKYNPDLLITVDCGISSADDIKFIKNELNIEVIVTDHHILPPMLPDCIIFNPKTETAFSELCGAGVVLRLIEALSDQTEMLKFIDIAAIATIADIVSLTSDNRILTSLGIAELKKKQRRGLKYLFDIAKADYTASDIAYKIAPRINAVGRLSDANKVVELFISNDSFLLQSIVKDIDNDNIDRRLISEQLYKEALVLLKDYDLINNYIIILSNPKWDIGVLGIAAAKICREFNRPAILFSSVNGLLKGSGRSTSAINLYGALLPFKDKFISFGGHSQAVGISIENFYLKEFITSVSNNIKNTYTFNEFIKNASDAIDLEDNLNIKIFKDMEKLEPFGCGNIKPVFSIDIKNKKFIALPNSNHIKAKLSDNIELIGFNLYDNLSLLLSGIGAKAIIDINISKYNGYGQCIINSIQYQYENNYNEVIDAQYFKQLLYKDNSSKEYKLIQDIKGILPLNSAIYGTLFIASKLNSCYNIINDFKGYLAFNIQSKNTLNPINTVILAPNKSCVSDYYERVVFIDKPMSAGYIDKFINKGVKEIYILDKNIDNELKIKINADKIIEFRQIIGKIAVKSRVNSLDELYGKVSKVTVCSYLEFSLIFYILFELKIVRIEKEFNITIDNDIAMDLSKSNVYRRINEH